MFFCLRMKKVKFCLKYLPTCDRWLCIHVYLQPRLKLQDWKSKLAPSHSRNTLSKSHSFVKRLASEEKDL
jgi:hypothetical protein